MMADSSVTIFNPGSPPQAASRAPSVQVHDEGNVYSTVQQSNKEVPQKRRFARERLHHLTWANYTTTMSWGGIAILLKETPHRFYGLDTIGLIVFIMDLVLFICITVGILSRFLLYRGTLMGSLAHPTESLFFPTFWLSIATIISNIQQYGVPHCGPWLLVVIRVLFWCYSGLTFLVAVGQYHLLFTGKPLTLQSMTPAWILPIFPVMLSGTLAALTSASQPVDKALPILVAGLTFQGLGLLVSCFMYANYLGRLMRFGLPEPAKRPGMFIAVGPPSFTAVAFLGMSSDAPRMFPQYTGISGVSNLSIIPDILRVNAITAAILLWALSFWFFSISLVSVLAGVRLEWISFHLSWWSFVFPNVGFTLALINIGKAFESNAILWVCSTQTILLVCMWLFVGTCHTWAVYHKKIMWPGKDEDHDD